MKLSQISLVLSAATLMAGSLLTLDAEETLIVNSASAVSGVNADQLKDYFLGKKTAWDDGSKVVVVVVKEGSSSDALLSRLGKNSQQFMTGWKKLVFTGKASMPEQVDSDDALVALVAKTPGAIGLVDKSKVKDGVKAISIQ
jgi:ABC-type phosphate transport system substrate-binding protein